MSAVTKLRIYYSLLMNDCLSFIYTTTSEPILITFPNNFANLLRSNIGLLTLCLLSYYDGSLLNEILFLIIYTSLQWYFMM